MEGAGGSGPAHLFPFPLGLGPRATLGFTDPSLQLPHLKVPGSPWLHPRVEGGRLGQKGPSRLRGPYLPQQVLGIPLEPAWVERTVHADRLEQLLLVLPVEW